MSEDYMLFDAKFPSLCTLVWLSHIQYSLALHSFIPTSELLLIVLSCTAFLRVTTIVGILPCSQRHPVLSPNTHTKRT